MPLPKARVAENCAFYRIGLMKQCNAGSIMELVVLSWKQLGYERCRMQNEITIEILKRESKQLSIHQILIKILEDQ